jgi:hypothetical protein
MTRVQVLYAASAIGNDVLLHELPDGAFKLEADVVHKGVITRLVRVGHSPVDALAKLRYTFENQHWWHPAWDRYFQRRMQPN